MCVHVSCMSMPSLSYRVGPSPTRTLRKSNTGFVTPRSPTRATSHRGATCHASPAGLCVLHAVRVVSIEFTECAPPAAIAGRTRGSPACVQYDSTAGHFPLDSGRLNAAAAQCQKQTRSSNNQSMMRTPSIFRCSSFSCHNGSPLRTSATAGSSSSASRRARTGRYAGT